MKWHAKDVEMYLQAKEYVDTAIIPLVSITWDDAKSTVQQGEYISLLTDELERQFRGRVFQFPPYTYIKNIDVERRLAYLNEIEHHLKENGFRHIIYVTSDSEWKTAERDIEQILLWLPSLPLEQLDQKSILKVITDQITQIIPIMTNKWQKGQNVRN